MRYTKVATIVSLLICMNLLALAGCATGNMRTDVPHMPTTRTPVEKSHRFLKMSLK